MTNTTTTYKRLGDYIREVDVRNTKSEVNLSQGICNQKYFQNPRQVSATPHLDKIVRKGQFAYNRATTRNGNKISIAYREGEDCTVSSAYCVFYIIDEEKLNPYYLWLCYGYGLNVLILIGMPFLNLMEVLTNSSNLRLFVTPMFLSLQLRNKERL